MIGSALVCVMLGSSRRTQIRIVSVGPKSIRPRANLSGQPREVQPVSNRPSRLLSSRKVRCFAICELVIHRIGIFINIPNFGNLFCAHRLALSTLTNLASLRLLSVKSFTEGRHNRLTNFEYERDYEPVYFAKPKPQN